MLKMTKYYDEFLRYYEMAKWQHENCNLGTKNYKDSPFNDNLMKNVYLYDVIERKYAGFNQLLLDVILPFDKHPYKHKMDKNRKTLIDSIDRSFWNLEEYLYICFVHRLTGSGINYAQSPSGYYNSILKHYQGCDSIQNMVNVYKNFKGPKFTSMGYQIAPFPKPKEGYSKGGDYFICHMLPKLVVDFCKHLKKGKKSFRQLMSWLEKYNQDLGIRVFRFQYAATLADIADLFPEYVDVESHFFYGKNAAECLNYLAVKDFKSKGTEFLDLITERISEDTGMLAYNAEDVACDFIRWVENYINPKMDYSHLDLDKIWSSHKIYDHPFGRQKPMLELGLVKTFNGKSHPSDDKIIKEQGLTINQYKDMLL